MVHSFSRPEAGPTPIGSRVRGLTVAALLALAGCASVPPPDAAMSAAQSQLQVARDADAADYAPVDLGFAQNKFQQAQAAMVSRKYADAADLAAEAQADAELATAKARLGDVRARIQSKSNENSRLREAMEQAHPELSGRAQAMPSGLPAAAPTGDMPAPSSSVLGAPLPAAGGFQTVPQPASSAGDAQGGQP
jgi:hypothetical protein